MRATSLLRTILNLKQTKVVSFEFSPSGLVVDVAPTTRVPRCGCCARRCPRVYDGRTRRWRHLDFAGMEVVLRYRIRRLECDRCGVTTELVPWAEPGGWFTRDFEDTVALLAQRTDKTTITELMGISWQTVGNIITRVVERLGPTDLLNEVTRIGIDEISYKRHHHYLTVVTDHERGRVIWAARGRNSDTLRGFFDELGAERSAALEVVSVDMCQAYIDVVRERAPKAVLVFDRFHVQRLAHDALDEVRRAQVRELKGTNEWQAVKKTRWALQKNPWNLTTVTRPSVLTGPLGPAESAWPGASSDAHRVSMTPVRIRDNSLLARVDAKHARRSEAERRSEELAWQFTGDLRSAIGMARPQGF